MPCWPLGARSRPLTTKGSPDEPEPVTVVARGPSTTPVAEIWSMAGPDGVVAPVATRGSGTETVARRRLRTSALLTAETPPADSRPRLLRLGGLAGARLRI